MPFSGFRPARALSACQRGAARGMSPQRNSPILSPQSSPRGQGTNPTRSSITPSRPPSSPAIVVSNGEHRLTVSTAASGWDLKQSPFSLPVGGQLLISGDCDAVLDLETDFVLPPGRGRDSPPGSPQSSWSHLKRRCTPTPISAAAHRRESLGPNTVRVTIAELLQWHLTDSPGKDGLMVTALSKEAMAERETTDLLMRCWSDPVSDVCSATEAEEEPAIIPRMSRITKINGVPLCNNEDLLSWLCEHRTKVGDGQVLLHYALPQKSLELLLKDGKELRANWKSRMDWIKGMWCDKNGKRLFEIDGFAVTVRCDAISDQAGQIGPQKQIIPFNDQIWLEDLWLNLADSTKSVLKWQRSQGRVQLWRRPKESDVAFRRWKKHLKSVQSAPCGIASPPTSPELGPVRPPAKSVTSQSDGLGQPRQSASDSNRGSGSGPSQSNSKCGSVRSQPAQGRFARMLRGLCCASQDDVADSYRR